MSHGTKAPALSPRALWPLSLIADTASPTTTTLTWPLGPMWPARTALSDPEYCHLALRNFGPSLGSSTWDWYPLADTKVPQGLLIYQEGAYIIWNPVMENKINNYNFKRNKWKICTFPNIWRLTCFEAEILLLTIYLWLCLRGVSRELSWAHVSESSRQRQIEMNLFNNGQLSFPKCHNIRGANSRSGLTTTRHPFPNLRHAGPNITW